MRAVFLDFQTFSQSLDITPIKKSVGTLTIYQNTAQEDIEKRCLDADIIITNKVILTASILENLSALKLICITATGYNNVDLVASSALNIAVTNVSGYAKNSVSQYVFAQLLSYFSNINEHNQNAAQGLWQKSPTFCLHGNGSVELAGKTMGIIGYGAIGEKIANIAQAFDMKVLIAERADATDIRSGRVDFNQVVSLSDVISLHCPQTPQTEGFFNLDVFKKMKPTAILINTARGALINDEDLLIALNEGEISAAILDVLNQEPPPKDHKLLEAQSDHLIITAHIAWASQQAQQTLMNLVAKNITAFTNNERLNRI